MTVDQFRRIALKLDGAIEASHMGHPDFRANGRIFATIYPDGERGMVKLTPAQQKISSRRIQRSSRQVAPGSSGLHHSATRNRRGRKAWRGADIGVAKYFENGCDLKN